jgi:hypothetical protein
MAATARPRVGTGLRPVGHRGAWRTESTELTLLVTDWQPIFNALDLPDQTELVQTMNSKVGDGYVIYNFVNTGST